MPAAKVYTINGRSGTLKQWAAWTGISLLTLRNRLYKLKVSPAEAVASGPFERTDYTVEEEAVVIREALKGGRGWAKRAARLLPGRTSKGVISKWHRLQRRAGWELNKRSKAA